MILVIGYGNTLYGDDGIGFYAAELLSSELQRDDIDFYAIRQLTPELAEPISRANAVIFIDAWVGGTPGQIEFHEVTPSARTAYATPGAFTHHVQATGLLDSAQSLYGRHPLAYLYAVSGQDYALGAEFSPAVQAALPHLLDAVKEKIEQCTNLALLNQS